MKLKMMLMIFAVLMVIGGVSATQAWAEEEVAVEPTGVLGCNGIELDPSASLESQQDICGAAEQFADSSCGRSGHGLCSSPKTNGTNPEGTHCVCLSEMTEEAPADPVL